MRCVLQRVTAAKVEVRLVTACHYASHRDQALVCLSGRQHTQTRLHTVQSQCRQRESYNETQGVCNLRLNVHMQRQCRDNAGTLHVSTLEMKHCTYSDSSHTSCCNAG